MAYQNKTPYFKFRQVVINYFCEDEIIQFSLKPIKRTFFNEISNNFRIKAMFSILSHSIHVCSLQNYVVKCIISKKLVFNQICPKKYAWIGMKIISNMWINKPIIETRNFVFTLDTRLSKKTSSVMIGVKSSTCIIIIDTIGFFFKDEILEVKLAVTLFGKQHRLNFLL